MGFRVASGTKPSQLNNPIVNKDDEMAMEKAPVNLKQEQVQQPVQKQQISQPQPSQTPAPQIQSQNSNDGVDISAFSQYMGDNQEDQSQNPNKKLSKQDVMDLFSNTETDHTMLGRKFKQDKDGNITIKEIGRNKYHPLNNAERALYGSYLDILNNSSANKYALLAGGAGALIGGVAPLLIGQPELSPIGAEAGAETGATLAAATASVLPSLGSIAGRVIGNGALQGGAAYLGSKQDNSEDAWDDYLSHPENQKTYYFLNKIAGNTVPEMPMDPNAAAVAFGAGGSMGELLSLAGETVGRYTAKSMASKEVTNKAMGEIASSMEPHINELGEASKDVGVPLTSMDVIPGSGMSPEANSLEQQSVKNQAVRTVVNSENNKKINSVNKFVDNIYARLGIKPDSDKFNMSIYKPDRVGFDDKNNFVGDLIREEGKKLSMFRQFVSEEARQRKFTATEYIKRANDVIKAAVPGAPDIESARDLNAVSDRLRSKFGDKETKEVLGFFQDILNETSVPESAFERSPQQLQSVTGVGSNNAGNLERGLNFNFVTKMTDKLQDQASRTDNPYTAQLAGIMRDFENDIIHSTLNESGKKSLAEDFIAQKASYADKIGALSTAKQSLSGAIDRGAIGEWALSLPNRTLKMMKPLVSQSQWNEMVDDVLRTKLFKEASSVGGKVSSKDIASMFGNEAMSENLKTLIGEKESKNLMSAMKVLDVLENKKLNLSGIEGQSKMFAKLMSTTPGQWVNNVVDYALSERPDIADLLKEDLSNYRKFFQTKTYDRFEEYKNKVYPGLSKSAGTIGRVSGLAAKAAPFELTTHGVETFNSIFNDKDKK
jgi:hypothetical protein